MTTYPIPATGHNWPLIDATRKLIGELPDARNLDPVVDGLPDDERAWNQTDWRCDTGRCWAGWAAVLAGGEFVYDVYENRYVDIDHETGTGGNRVAHATAVVVADGETWHVADFAQHALGLGDRERATLFDGANTLADIDLVLTAMRDQD